VPIDQLTLAASGRLVAAFFILVIVLLAYSIYYIVFKFGK
jgi:hypothetical protein